MQVKPKQIADALLEIGYKNITHELHKLDRLLHYDAEVSDQLDTERTAEQIADILTDLYFQVQKECKI